MKRILLFGILCSVSVFSSCNIKPTTYDVKINSDTLIIDNTVATQNKDYETTISLIDSIKDYRLPKLINITILDKKLSNEDYTYDFNNGRLKINGNVITNNITISGEGVALEVYKVNMNSDTLTISNTSATESKDYEGIISLVKTVEDYRLPTLITITIDGKMLDDKNYNYDFNSGKIKINGNVVVNDITISGESEELDAYKANFECDSHVKVFIYKSRDYTVNPDKSTNAFSRDKESGKKTKDGTGEINFKVEIDENYDIDMLWVKGLYDKCQDNEKTKKDDVYRITKIRSDLQIKITTTKIYCKNMAFYGDLNTNSFTFKWSIRNTKNFDHTDIEVTAKDYSKHFETSDKKFTFSEAHENKRYNLTFTPVLKSGKKCLMVSYSCFLTDKKNVSGLPRVTIETENNVLPIMKYPVANYVQNIIKIYNRDNTLVYDSTIGLKEKGKYDGSKIKIRGNSSARDYEKKPYKIKLKNSYDLLEKFRLPTNDKIDYSNKDWLLMSPNTNNAWGVLDVNNQILHTPIGFCVANALDFDWKPFYQFVTLYLNGSYQGIYILCECTSKGDGQGDKQSRYKVEKDGFIIEKDYYWYNENLYIKTPISGDNRCRFTFKYPDTDDFNKESSEYKYIEQYLLRLENLILNNDKTYYDLIDRLSLIRWLLAQDIISNEDYLGSNIFLYKKDSTSKSKLMMGTIWDYGMSLKNPNALALIRDKNNFYYKWILQQPDFNNDLKSLYLNEKEKIKTAIANCLNSFNSQLYDKLLSVETLRWNIKSEEKLDAQKEYVNTFFTNHFNYLDNNL